MRFGSVESTFLVPTLSVLLNIGYDQPIFHENPLHLFDRSFNTEQLELLRWTVHLHLA